MAIRWRLTLWFSLILFAILAISGILFYAALQSYLISAVDNNLKTYSARVHGTLNTDNLPGSPDYNIIHSSLPPINEFVSPGVYIQLIDGNGTVVVKSDNLGDQELPVSLALIEKGFNGAADIETLAAGDSARIRTMVSPLYLEDQTLLLEVAQSLTPIDITMERLRLALSGEILLALMLSVVLGFALVGRTLTPVENITRTARNIEASSDLSRRVGYKGQMDELGRLATTFDHLIEHLDKVFQSQKNFVADASHQLRTPLTVIQGNIDLLKLNLSKEERQESLQVIEAESKRMAKIVSDLLLLAEIESGQVERKEKVSLQEIVLEELKRAKSLAGSRKIAISRLEDVVITGDVFRLKELLGNLVDNAIKYTPDGGTIAMSLFQDGEWARLEVADTGVGIAPEHMPHLFERFYRVGKVRSRAGNSTGLGLSIVKGIAEQHGGKMTVTSEPGKGSTFTAWLKL